jgi:hypothetical protein
MTATLTVRFVMSVVGKEGECVSKGDGDRIRGEGQCRGKKKRKKKDLMGHV